MMRKFRLFSFGSLKMNPWSCTLGCRGLFLLLLLVSGCRMAAEAHVASEWRSHYGRVAPQYKQAKENAEFQNNTLILLVHCSQFSLSLSFLSFSLFLFFCDKHRTVLARDEEQFEAGQKCGKVVTATPFHHLWILSCFLSACFACASFTTLQRQGQSAAW